MRGTLQVGVGAIGGGRAPTSGTPTSPGPASHFAERGLRRLELGRPPCRRRPTPPRGHRRPRPGPPPGPGAATRGPSPGRLGRPSARPRGPARRWRRRRGRGLVVPLPLAGVADRRVERRVVVHQRLLDARPSSDRVRVARTAWSSAEWPSAPGRWPGRRATRPRPGPRTARASGGRGIEGRRPRRPAVGSPSVSRRRARRGGSCRRGAPAARRSGRGRS